MSTYYQRRMDRGRCARCPADAVAGQTLCLPCRLIVRGEQSARAEARHAAGVCVDCGGDAVPGRWRCQNDLDLRKSRARTAAALRRGRGMCTYCGREPALSSLDRCLGCKLASLEKTGRERGNKRGRAKVKKWFASVPRADIEALWARQQGRCAVTGTQLRLVGQEHDSVSLDHILPFSRGGSHTIKNLRFTCYLVNMLKRNLTETEFLEVIGEDGPSRLRKFIEARAAI